MAEVQRFSQNMVLAALQANDWQFEVDDDGDYRVAFADDNIEIAVYPMVRGDENNILGCLALSPSWWSTESRQAVLEACNDWNETHRWPTAYLTTDGDGDLRVQLDWYVDLAPGVHHDLLLDMINTFVATAMGFWAWMRDDKQLLGTD